LNEEKSKHVDLAEQNGIRQIFLHNLLRQSATPVREECNKYDLINHNNWSWWFAFIVVSHLFAVPILVLWVELWKKVNN
jgi:hypothetical protein